ncbi:DUF3857 domain-containing protein [Lentisphaerota bacterium ZTH]|nr:DUF3857 domain-containing protein [Lentisphaerota bacterium]WET05930.1 DUF3857 domain-containing protein [Lentisphaerota bacterium ZTH]
MRRAGLRWCSRYLFVITAAMFIFAGSLAAKEVKPLLDRKLVLSEAAQVDLKKYPDADTVLISDYEKVKYNPDGTYTSVDEFYEKILTEKGRRESRVANLYFDLPYTKVIPYKIGIIKPDGRYIAIDIKANSKEMVNPSQMSANIYDPNSKILKITIPDLEIGDVLYKYVRRDGVVPRIKDVWCDFYLLEYTSPILKYVIEINGPKSRPLKKFMIKDPVKGTVKFSQKAAGDRIIYKWTAANVPQSFPEPQMPPFYMYSQRLLVSTAADWQEISRWYWYLCKPHLEKTNQAMREKVKELTAGLKTDMEKIKAIYRFVSTKIRYMGIIDEKTAPGYEPHDVDITFNNRYGVCRDKAALLVAMLQMAGFKAYPVLFYVGPKKDAEVPNNMFNHAISCVILKDGKHMLMDPTDESTYDVLPSYLSDKSYLLAKPEGDTLFTSPVTPVSENLVKIKTTGEISRDGKLKAESRMLFDGINDTTFRGAFSQWRPEQIKQYFTFVLKQSLPDARVTSFEVLPKNLRDFKKPLKVNIAFESSSILVKGRNIILVQLPWFSGKIGAVSFALSGLGLEKRKYPLKIFSTCGTVGEFSFKLPLGMQVVKLPEYKKVDWDKFSWKRKLSFKNHTLAGRSSFLINTMEFLPKDYLRLKSDLKVIETEAKKLPLLQKKCASTDLKYLKKLYPGSKSVILAKNVDIDFKDASTYSMRTVIKRKVLNYGGVKSFSELKFFYNSAWQQVKINYAKVKDPDGSVKNISKKETNLMDQSWTGSAPRYPGGKILVLNLPGVKVGSEIEYDVVIENSSVPLAGIMCLFKEYDPILSKKISITAPEKLALKFSKTPDVVESSVNRAKGLVSHVFKVSNVSPIAAESSTPPVWAFTPVIYVSAGNWKEFSKSVLTALTGAADKQEKTKEQAVKLAMMRKPLEAMRSIRDFIAIQVRDAGPGFSSMPLSTITPADKTLKDGYGNSTDRAVLTYAMLQAVGFKPEFVMVADIFPIPRAMQALKAFPRGQFDDILVKVRYQGKDYYFNDTSQYAMTGATDSESMIVYSPAKDKLEYLYAQPELNSLYKEDYNIQISRDGSAEITKTKAFYGESFENANRLYSEFTPEERRRHFQELVSGVAQAATAAGKLVTNFEKYPGVEEFRVKIPAFAVVDNGYMYFKLPGLMISEIFKTASNERSNPVMLGSYNNYEQHYRIKLPAEMTEFDIRPVSRVLKVGPCVVRIKVSKSADNELLMKCSVKLRPGIISAAEFGILEDAQSVLSNPAMGTVMIKLKK